MQKRNQRSGHDPISADSLLVAIVESSDDAIISKDLNGIVTSWNQAAERIFGYTAGEMVGQPITTLIPPERIHEEATILERIRKGDRIDHYETVRVTKEGRKLHASITVSPIRNEAGTVIGASKILRDITPQIQAQQALQAAQKQLEEQAQELELRVQERTVRLQETIGELEAFSYTVSHDLRAPLRAMQQFAQMLLEDHAGQLDAEGKSLLNRIVASSQRLDALIRDVLTYASMLRTSIRLEPINVDKLMADIIQHYPLLQPPKAEIEVRSPLSWVLGNEALLTQCISNLLTNAVKFVSKGTKPTIQIWTERLPGGANGGMVRLSIQDNGIGIAPEHQKRIFGMFERLHSGSEYEGTGIGLAIVRKAVERMGGVVGVTSQVGKGSTFWIDLCSAVRSPNGYKPDFSG